MANNFTGRILRIDTAGVNIPLANFTVDGGEWTGGTAADVFTVTDVAGRAYSWTFPADGSAVVFKRMPFSGPLAITALPHGVVIWALAAK